MMAVETMIQANTIIKHRQTPTEHEALRLETVSTIQTLDEAGQRGQVRLGGSR